MAKENDQPAFEEGSLLSHLLELRSRLLKAIVGILIIFFGLVPFSSILYGWLASPLLSKLPEHQSLIATNPAGAFFAPMKLTFFVAAFIAAPWLLYQAWAFVAPGLYRNEKKLAAPILVSSVLLFYIGCAFAYFLVLPGVFGFLTTFKPEVVAITPDIGAYLDFVLVLFLAFGISFELPIALVIMVILGWVTPQQLREWRGYAIVAIFVLAAIITPPDVISQLMLAIPMCLLYEAGILASRLIAPKPDQTQHADSGS